MGMAENLGSSLFGKRAEVERGDPIEARAGVAPELIRESLKDHPELKTLTLDTIQGDALKNERFVRLMESMLGPDRPEHLMLGLANNTLTDPELQELHGVVEEFKSRCAIAEAATKHLNTGMLDYARQFSPDLERALAGTNDSATVAKILHKDIWEKVMGTDVERDSVRSQVDRLGAVQQASESPRRRRAEASIVDKLQKHKIKWDEFKNAIDANDPAGSVSRIRGLIEDRNYATGWRKWLNAFDYAGDQAQHLYDLAMNPHTGGLATAELQIRDRIGELGTMLAVSTVPNMRQALNEAAFGGSLEDSPEEQAQVLTSVEQLGDLHRRVNRVSLWNDFDSYAGDPDNRWPPATPTFMGPGRPFNNLTPTEREDYMRDYVVKSKDRNRTFSQRLGMLGYVFRVLADNQLDDFEEELIRTLGERPASI